jgi:magnesium chelatase family protein
VLDARLRQRERFGESSGVLNRQLEGMQLTDCCRLDARGTAVLEAAIQKFCLSARGCDRVLRVSRTIADLDGARAIASTHITSRRRCNFAGNASFSPHLRHP